MILFRLNIKSKRSLESSGGRSFLVCNKNFDMRKHFQCLSSRPEVVYYYCRGLRAERGNMTEFNVCNINFISNIEAELRFINEYDLKLIIIFYTSISVASLSLALPSSCLVCVSVFFSVDIYYNWRFSCAN